MVYKRAQKFRHDLVEMIPGIFRGSNAGKKMLIISNPLLLSTFCGSDNSLSLCECLITPVYIDTETGALYSNHNFASAPVYKYVAAASMEDQTNALLN
jgi:hypothetical protein